MSKNEDQGVKLTVIHRIILLHMALHLIDDML